MLKFSLFYDVVWLIYDARNVNWSITGELRYWLDIAYLLFCVIYINSVKFKKLSKTVYISGKNVTWLSCSQREIERDLLNSKILKN